MEYVVAALVIENVAQFKVGLFFPTKIRCFEWRSCQMFFGETAADRSRRQTSGLLQLSEVCRMLFSTNYVHTNILLSTPAFKNHRAYFKIPKK